MARTVEEAAVLFQTFRSPQFEVVHWIFTEAGKVVGRYAVTAHKGAPTRWVTERIASPDGEEGNALPLALIRFVTVLFFMASLSKGRQLFGRQPAQQAKVAGHAIRIGTAVTNHSIALRGVTSSKPLPTKVGG
jgi:hypothetical protein